MGNEAHFATDLYQGTAGYYDRYRLPYPAAMLTHLVESAHLSGQGRLLDLACGTGQLAFPLSPHFAEVWAVDQEPDMVEVVRAKSAAEDGLRPIVAGAETLDAQPDYFELAVVGNAFHRLDRDLVARRLLHWLTPGGHLALCWSTSPWAGGEDWQRTLAATLKRWQQQLDAEHRVPESAGQARQHRPDPDVLAAAGFEIAGRHAFTVEHHWSLAELAGHIRSTSFLPPAVLRDRAEEFDADLAASLRPHSDSGIFTENVSFAYDLARKPA
ncbi:class I SAM-dependent methyltransferase [Amycolatopsis sp. DSM 110486]|uniref:class I SAM-dependent methyltransferase n=1 Tax=Amycolatopsis sp. DSM 110486 TaxID=2865832 RepID=UPI001C69EF4C|nr:class I SAM-dependent methyltransferase [Amycolatopsis sp. DSM 110486]QYN18947.1 methyltransferase domain-containing protein [Amycolatopsis sp. DSM 110486]